MHNHIPFCYILIYPLVKTFLEYLQNTCPSQLDIILVTLVEFNKKPPCVHCTPLYRLSPILHESHIQCIGMIL